jgi:hypothetical protein
VKIVSIFADNIYSLHYDGETDNEFDRLMDLWTDVSFLRSYAIRNGVKDVYGFVNHILLCAEDIQDFLHDISQGNKDYNFYFQALQQSENYSKRLELQKGKIHKNQLRLYAIKIDISCFVVTGGAIKMSQKMEDHSDTLAELGKLATAKSYFEKNGVFDEDSFFELLIENNENE